jgi:hypothetical protein
MVYKYGEIFAKLGILDMGHQGATWCSLNPDGVMVLMAHQNYFHKRRGMWQYETPDEGVQPSRGPSATRSLKMLDEYFSADREILLPVAEFITDGGIAADGTWRPSEFNHATGAVYEARMKAFELRTGYLLCDIDRKFTV